MNDLEFRKIILNSSSPYLVAPTGKWIDADRKEVDFSEMSKDWKMNCLKTLLKLEDTIEKGGFLDGVSFDRERYYDEVLGKAISLFHKKCLELGRELGY